MAERRKRPVVVGLVGLGFTLWDRIGDLLQARDLRDLWRDYGPVMESLGWLIEQAWFGPALIGLAVVGYFGMGFWEDWFGKKRSTDPLDDTPTTNRSTATGGNVSDSGNSKAVGNKIEQNFFLHGNPLPTNQETPSAAHSAHPTTRPKISLLLEEVFSQDLIFDSRFGQQFSAVVWFARVLNTSTEDDDVAKNIRVSILFKPKGKPTIHVDGYWIWDLAQVQKEMVNTHAASAEGHREVWIKARQRKHIVLALKTRSGPSVCAFDHVSAGKDDLKRSGLQLPAENMDVTIELVGPRVHQVYEFVFTHDGKDSKFVIATKDAAADEPASNSSETVIRHKDWQKLGAAFKAVQAYSLRADWQKSDVSGEQWSLRGGPQECREAEVLCRQGGAMLLKSPNVKSQLSERVLAQSNHVWRWLEFVKEQTGGLDDLNHAVGTNKEGVPMETLFFGKINDLKSKSMRVCTDCATTEM